MKMIRSASIALAVTALVLTLFVGTITAGDRSSTPVVEIGRCELPLDVTVADGWDIDPALGYWGGVDESEFAVVWAPGSPDVPTLAGREAVCTISGLTGHKPTVLKVLALNGLANDDYCVFVEVRGQDVRIGCYDETSTTEEWITTEFTLPRKIVARGQDMIIKVFATGNAWSGFNTWGQLGVDRIEIWGKGYSDDEFPDD